MKVFFALLLGLEFVVQIHSVCNVCTSEKRACISESEVAVCGFDNEPTNHTILCPPDQICDFDATCKPKDSVLMQACVCKKCNADRSFACTGYNTFALCLGKDTPQEVSGTCSTGYVCNMNSPQICTMEDNGSSCSKNMVELPPPAPSNPTEYCQRVQKKERFPLGTNAETDCKQYVYCFQSSTGWVGAIYYCSGGTYFHDHINGCKADKPARCSVGVRGIFLQ